MAIITTYGKTIRTSNWLRVSKQNPCKICDKDNWCTYTEEDAVCCMRIKSEKTMKNGGWLHVPILFKPNKYVPCKVYSIMPQTSEESPDFPSLWIEYQKSNTPQSLIIFAEKLGIDPMSLHLIGCAWSFKDNAWAFPMRSEHFEAIGIRLRNELGHKYAVKGSKSGLFIPLNFTFNNKEYLYICEGPTDTAAALCMGLQAIGRPSCLGLEEMISSYVRKLGFKRVVILSDNDDPGQRGALKLQESLRVSSCILTMPCKDIREFYCNGGTKKALESILSQHIWTKK